MIFIGYMTAVLMGMVLGVLGAGGSILTVPILVYLMGVSPSVATGYSLLIVGTTAAFGAIKYFREGLINVKTSLLFATLMLASAGMMLKKAYSKSATAPEVIEHKQPNIGLIVVEGAVVGVVTGILGAGGGFLIIPALVLMLGMPMQNAVGASLFIIALKSLLGFIGDLQTGIQLEMPLLPLILLATFAGMAISTKIAGKLDGVALQKCFAFFNLVIAVFIITKELL